jgi:hypothetical protein
MRVLRICAILACPPAVATLLQWDAIWMFLAPAVSAVCAIGIVVIERQERSDRGRDDPISLKLRD